jgi:hypothetical protein
MNEFSAIDRDVVDGIGKCIQNHLLWCWSGTKGNEEGEEELAEHVDV